MAIDLSHFVGKTVRIESLASIRNQIAYTIETSLWSIRDTHRSPIRMAPETVFSFRSTSAGQTVDMPI